MRLKKEHLHQGLNFSNCEIVCEVRGKLGMTQIYQEDMKFSRNDMS